MSYQICGACFGTCRVDGKLDGKPCPRCDGTGRVLGPLRVPKIEEIRAQRKPGFTDLDDHVDWLKKSVERLEKGKEMTEPTRTAFLLKEAGIASKRARELLNLLKGKVTHDKGQRAKAPPPGDDQDRTDRLDAG
jgi:hypothetical protein